MMLLDSIHPAEWENPTPEQMRTVQLGLRYVDIAAWLERDWTCWGIPRGTRARRESRRSKSKSRSFD
jgi:hypothetical protein